MRLKTVLMVILALLFGYSTYWFFVANNTDVFLEKLESRLENNGILFSYDNYEISGFPYRLVIDFSNVVIKFENNPLKATLLAKNIQAVLQPWKLNHAIMFPSNSEISVSYIKEQEKNFFLKPNTLAISYSTSADNGYRMSMDMTAVQLTSNLQLNLPYDYDSISFHIHKPFPQSSRKDNLFEPKILNIALSAIAKNNDSFATDISFHGQDIPQLNTQSLGFWRDQGGTMEIKSAIIQIDNRKITANGSLALDNQLRPIGAIGIETYNSTDFLQFLRSTNIISSDKLEHSSILLDDLNSSKEPFSIFIEIRNGAAYLGLLELFEIRPIINN